MRIGLISTPYVPVPPPAYGGTELIVAELCDGLSRMGHEVVLYTCGPAQSGQGGPRGVEVRTLYRQPVWPIEPYHEVQHVAWALSDLLLDERVDVIHAHCPAALPLARFVGIPMVYTMHHRPTASMSSLYTMQRGVHFVCISARQRELSEALAPRAEVVHHGLDANRYPLGSGGKDLVFLGRLSDEKGPAAAIDVAARAGLRIHVAGKPHAGDERYYEAEVRRRLGLPHVRYLGEVGFAEKVPLLGSARATLCPIAWEEPFGLVLIESMLCGTPVIAFRRGSVPEIVDEGVTGFVVDSEEEMVARVRSLDGFDRTACRARAVERFDRARMVRDYLDVYARAASGVRAAFMRDALADAGRALSLDGGYLAAMEAGEA